MGDEAGVGAVFQHRGRGPAASTGSSAGGCSCAASRAFASVGVLVGRAFVGIPHFDGGIDVQHAAVVAPLQQFAAVDVPRQVDQEVAGGEVLAENLAHVVPLNLGADKFDALLDPGRAGFPSDPQNPSR